MPSPGLPAPLNLVGTAVEALGEVFLRKEILHHRFHTVPRTEAQRRILSVPAGVNLLLLEAEDDPPAGCPEPCLSIAAILRLIRTTVQ